MSILDLLRSDGSIVVNKKLAHRIGLNEAIILSEIISLYLYFRDRGELTEDGWFFATHNKIEENTTLKRSAQDKALETLYALGLIHKEMRGLPAKRHFKIDEAEISSFVTSNKDVGKRHAESGADPESKSAEKTRGSQHVGKQQTSQPETDNQDSAKTTANNTNVYNHDLRTEEEETTSARELDELFPEYRKVIDMTQEYGSRQLTAGERAFLGLAQKYRIPPEIAVKCFWSAGHEIIDADPELVGIVMFKLSQKLQERRPEHQLKSAGNWFSETWQTSRAIYEMEKAGS